MNVVENEENHKDENQDENKENKIASSPMKKPLHPFNNQPSSVLI